MFTDTRRWVYASLLLLVGALVAAAALWLHWLPCRGSMLNGSVLQAYRYGPDFSDACLRAMDNGFGLVDSAAGGVWSAEGLLGTLAVLLQALAWVCVVAGSGWSAGTKRWALLPALATASILVLNVHQVAEALGGLSMLVWFAPNVFAVVAFAAIGVGARPGVLEMTQVALVLAGSTTAGLLATIADYMIMGRLSEADWDAPPGSGYPTVATMVLIAVGLLVTTVRHSPARPNRRRALLSTG